MELKQSTLIWLNNFSVLPWHIVYIYHHSFVSPAVCSSSPSIASLSPQVAPSKENTILNFLSNISIEHKLQISTSLVTFFFAFKAKKHMRKTHKTHEKRAILNLHKETPAIHLVTWPPGYFISHGLNDRPDNQWCRGRKKSLEGPKQFPHALLPIKFVFHVKMNLDSHAKHAYAHERGGQYFARGPGYVSHCYMK